MVPKLEFLQGAWKLYVPCVALFDIMHSLHLFDIMHILSIFSHCETDDYVWGALPTHVFYGSIKIPNNDDISCAFLLKSVHFK